MTKRIEEILNLPSMADDYIDEDLPDGDTIITNFDDDELTSMMIDPDGVKKHESEMDEVYKKAMSAHDDAIDLAFNIEAKNAAAVISAAANMLDLAMKSSQSKTDAKMKSIKLKMEQEKHKKTIAKEEEGVIDGEVPLSGSFIANRNDLLKNNKG